jgi:hypothetical protein
MITNYNLFLDDIRIPTNVTWVNVPKDQHYSLVRNYQEFVDLITLRGLPKFVCYDHDLGLSHYGHGLNGDDIVSYHFSFITNYNNIMILSKLTYFINKSNQINLDYYQYKLSSILLLVNISIYL